MNPGPEAPIRITVAVCAYVLLVVWVTLRGLDTGLRKSGCAAPIRRSLLVRIGALLGTWFLAITASAVAGAWLDPGVPRALGYLIPALLLSLVLWRAGWLQAAVQALSPSAIPWLQTLRIGGGLTLFAAWAAGLAPWGWVASAGTGDILVGLGAAAVAALLGTGLAWSRTAAQLWNVFGLVDMAHTMLRGLLSAPGPQQRLFETPPNLVPAVFPFIYLPAFIVPLTILLHILSLQQLARVGRPARTAAGA
ncbi:MAG TPA: hypothetical protein VMT11_16250 [Myxococcaceae bacterium]|nr:hypothetical protein [Myxococcaceae bacterium]